ncbi:MAG: CHC2 zinc finger domain-containing protein, partial [Sulfurovum sp.]|nr:CHC2 zinc finger domain-containing protein [Sulfurovum sp.]
MIDNASIESLKNSIDIVDVIGNYIELKKAGANYKANCPFHGEKTPSFVVSPSKQIYHCFGCGAGGDTIKFVMEIEKLSYPEAIEKLASMYNFSLRYTKGSSDYSDAKRVLEAVQTWYVKNLDQNPTAQTYLADRGISAASIEKFGIGYVPSGGQVMQFLQRTMLPKPQAAEAGVIAQGERGEYYARLVERITFPI